MNVGNWKQRKMSAKPSHWLFKLPQNIVCKGGGKVGGNHSAPVIVDWEGGGRRDQWVCFVFFSNKQL